MTMKVIKLGGGAKRKLPGWANPNAGNSQGPALDNEGMP